MLSPKVLQVVLEGIHGVQFGSSRPSFLQATLSPNWNSRHCNHRGTRSSQAQSPAAGVEASRSLVVAVGASQSLAVAVGAPGS